MKRIPPYFRAFSAVLAFVLVFYLVATTVAAPTLATIVVSPATPNGWAWALESGSNGSVTFANGPTGQPAGNGSARFQVNNNTTGPILYKAGAYPGLRFDQITALTYSLYKTAGANTNDVVFQFNVDYDLTDANTAWQGRLNYEPYYGGPLPVGSWSAIDPLAGGDAWWSTGAPGNATCTQANPCTWNQVLATFPNAGIQTGAIAGVNFKAGSGWATVFDGNVDNFHIVTSTGVDDTYDFDPVIPCTTTCYVSTTGSNSNGGTSPVDALRDIQVGINTVTTGGTVIVASGTYTEQLALNKAVTLQGSGVGVLAKNRPGPHTIVRWNGAGNPVTLTADNVTVDGFVFNAQGNNTPWIINGVAPVDGAYDNITIRYNEFLGNPGIETLPGGIYLVASINTLFEGNYFNDLGNHAVFMGATSNGTTYRNNDSFSNYNSNFSAHNGPHTNVTIENNRAIQDSVIVFNMDNSIVSNNAFTGTVDSENSALLYLGGSSDNDTIQGNSFHAVRNNAISVLNLGFGYSDNSNITVQNNTFAPNLGITQSGSGMVRLRDVTGTTSVLSNTISLTGTATADQIHGVVLVQNLATVVIANNTIDGNNVDTSPATPSHGVYAMSTLAGSTNITIRNNFINNWTNGIFVQNPAAGLTVRIRENNLSSNATRSIDNSGSVLVNASENWYGSNTAAGVAGVVSANVDYTPWFDSGTDASATLGWQGNYNALHADDSSPQSGTPARLQEAVNLVTTGGTVYAEAGTYAENVSIPKGLILDGTGAGIDPNVHTILEGTALGGHGITLTNGTSGVTIRDLRVQNYANGNGIFGSVGNNNTTIQAVHTYNNNTAGSLGGGGIYMNGPVNTVTITGGESVNNRGRGIVIWNGFKQNITITNNLVSGNNCCGIELNDGTASGVTITGNTVTGNIDSGIGAIGLMGGAGANLIANNTVTDNGRFGIEIKLPNGTGTTSGDGSIVVENNTVSRTVAIGAELRDIAGISVYRRGWVTGNNNVDIPTGVVVRNNTVSGYQQPSTSDGFGIAAEGLNMTVTGNTLNNNDVGIQRQRGHLPYTPNTNTDGDQSNLNDQYFGRGNSPVACVVIDPNTYSGNTVNQRTVGGAGGGLTVTNTNTGETFCSIQAAIDDSDTIAGHTIVVGAGTYTEQLTINKGVTLQGAGANVLAKDRPSAQSIVRWNSAVGTPVTLAADNITINGFVFNAQGNNTPWIINGVAPVGAAYDNVSIRYNEFLGNPGNNTFPGGIYMVASINTLFEGNYFNDLGQHAVFMGITSNGTTYRNNDSYGNYNSNFSAHNGPHTNATIENNRAIEDSMLFFNVDNSIVSGNVFTASATISARIYLGGGDDNDIIQNNTFRTVRNNGIYALDAGFGLGTNSNLTIQNNTFTPNAATIATGNGMIRVEDITGTTNILSNTITLTGTAVSTQTHGILLVDNLGTVVIANNTIDGNNVDTSPATPSHGIYLASTLAGSTNITIRNNFINDWVNGVYVENPAAGLTVRIKENHLGGNATRSIDNTGTTLVNASENWYGSNTAAGVASVVAANVDYTPWFDSGTDASATLGWQGNYNALHADDSSPQSGTPARLQEAVNLVTTGGTVYAEAGTYNENVSIPKALTLDGAGAGTNPATHTILDGTSLSGHGITLTSGTSGVTIRDLRVQGFANGNGIFGSVGNNNTTIQAVHTYNNNTAGSLGGGGIYMNGPVNTVTITGGESVNNRGRGIVIWNGFKQNITITNNLVTGQNCCGIELNDGTASGVTITGNTVTGNADSGIGVVGLMGGAGANLIANNTVTDNGRFGIEIKLPNGTGATSGDGSIVVENNTVSRTVAIGAELRDIAGISVYRRGWVAGNNNVDIPTGVVVRNNTVSGYQQPSTSDGFGIAAEGLNMTVTGNTLNNNDVGIQRQRGHLPYVPNTNTDGDQSNLNDQYFGRGNSPVACVVIDPNTYSGNTVNQRTVGGAGGGLTVTNTNTGETFCSIQAAIDDSDTISGHTIVVGAGTYTEQLTINKGVTLQGAGANVLAKNRPGAQTIVRWDSASGTPVTLSADNITINGFVFNAQGNNTPWIINGVSAPGGTYDNVAIRYNEFLGNPGNNIFPGGIYMVASINTLFEGNYFNDLGQHAVFMGATSNGTTYRNNDSYGNYNSNFSAHVGPHTNATIENNRAIEDSMLFFNVDNSIVSGNVFTASATISARIYLGGGDDNDTIQNNTFRTVRNNGIYALDAGFGLGTNSNLTIQNNTFTPNAATIATGNGMIRVEDITGTTNILSNTITLTGTAVSTQTHGILLIDNLATVTVANNIIDGNNADTSPATASHGVYLASTLAGTTIITIHNNYINEWTNGVFVETPAAGLKVRIRENNLSNNTTRSISNTGSVIVNASENWYGTNTAAGVAATISTNVDYTPWFDSGTDTSGTIGWQGNYNALHADDTSPQTGTTGRLQEGVNLVTTGGTVYAEAGTYAENVSIPKALTLDGAGAGTNPATHTILNGTSLTGHGITITTGTSGVTIRDLRVQNYANGNGIFGSSGNNNTTIQSVHTYNNNANGSLSGGGIYMNGPVNTVLITGGESVGNRGRGIVIWNGFKQNITITNNLVSGNNCCGIELNDGTASGVTITGNTVTGNTDSGIGAVGLMGGAGANLIANNTITDNGRFGIEIKLPNGTGATSGNGSIVVDNNTVSRTTAIGAELRDIAGISVYRRGWVAGNNNVDIPTGVVVRNNTVSGYQQPSTSEGFGIVAEGTNHQILNNTLTNNDVGTQAQGGHTPYVPNTSTDGDQNNLNDQFFGRGNSPIGCPIIITGNTYTTNGTNNRFIGAASATYRTTNLDTSEQFCTIQAAIDDSDTNDGDTIDVDTGTYPEQLNITKDLTIQGQGEGATTIVAGTTLTPYVTGLYTNYPLVYIHNTDAMTLTDLTVDFNGQGNAYPGSTYPEGVLLYNGSATLQNVTILDVRDEPLSGLQHGEGIYACADNGTARTFTADNVTVTGFQKNGMTLDCANLTVNVTNSTIIGAGPTTIIAQNGIQLSGGATGDFEQNTISDITYTPGTFSATGILMLGAPGTRSVDTNTITNAMVGIYLENTQADVTNNTITYTPAGMGSTPEWWGVYIFTDSPAPVGLGSTREMLDPSPILRGSNTTTNLEPMARSFNITGNMMDGGGKGTAIEIEIDAMEVTTVTPVNNTTAKFDTGIVFGGTGQLEATVTDSVIANNAVGIVIAGGDIEITDSSITENDVGIRYYSSSVSPEIHGNDIDYNDDYGIEHLGLSGTPTIVNAQGNYWGDISGPLDIVPEGSGPCPSLEEYNPISTGSPVSECVRWEAPLAVMIADFDANSRRDDILVTWETASETDNLGFNLYRATNPDAEPEKLNDEIIPSQAPGGGGASYEWADTDVELGVTYYYWLEAIDIEGNASPLYGPVEATYIEATAITLATWTAEGAAWHGDLWSLGLLLLAGGVVLWRRRSR